MPRNPKPGAPLGKRERDLSKALPQSDSVSDAGRKVGMSPQSAHDAFEALKIKAPVRCEQLGISRDRVLRRFEDWADGATREVFDKWGERKKLEATDLRIKANENLGKVFGIEKEREDGAEASHGSGQVIINLGFLNADRAEAILTVQSNRGTDTGGKSLPQGSIDVAPGE